MAPSKVVKFLLDRRCGVVSGPRVIGELEFRVIVEAVAEFEDAWPGADTHVELVDGQLVEELFTLHFWHFFESP